MLNWNLQIYHHIKCCLELLNYSKKETNLFAYNWAGSLYHTQLFNFYSIFFWSVYYLKVSSEVFLNNTLCCKSFCGGEGILTPMLPIPIPFHEVVSALHEQRHFRKKVVVKIEGTINGIVHLIL
jgi:hypothetical protein